MKVNGSDGVQVRWVISGPIFMEGIRHPNLQGMWEGPNIA